MEALASYIPASILSYLTTNDEKKGKEMTLPIRDSYESVVLFADVSGFTAMCEVI